MTGTEQTRSATEMMMAAVVVFFIIFLMFFYVYLHIMRRRSPLSFILSREQCQNGLEPAVINALPVTRFQSADFKDGLECAVCLCDLTDGEEIRLLQKCSHGFHLQCIDTWLNSNNSCPLCRSPVCGNHVVEIRSLGVEASPEPANFPANVLVWGTRNQFSNGVSTPAMPLAEISIRVSGGSPLPSLAREDIGLSGLARLRALQELLRREDGELNAMASSPDSPSLRELLSRREDSEFSIPRTPTSP